MLIGFTGLAQSGKSTACEYIIARYPDVTKIGFKDQLVQEMRKNFTPLIEEICLKEGLDPLSAFTVKPPLIRKLMQCYGTEVRRGDDPDYWVKRWMNAVSLNNRGIYNVVCDDVRFHNEAKAVRDMNGIVVRIVRSDITDTGTHKSETEMAEIVPDFTIVTKPGDLEGLHKDVDKILASVYNR